MTSTMDKKENLTATLRNMNLNLNSPYVRNIYLKQAEDEFEAGNIDGTVFYQTEALCLGYRCKYLVNDTSDNTSSLENIRREAIPNTKSFENPLLEYAAKIHETEKLLKPKHNCVTFETDPQKGMKEIREFCLSLPKEWTVLQVCKSFNPSSSSCTKSAIITADCPLYLSVLKNTQPEIYSDPLCFKIDMKSFGLNIYNTFYQITAKLKNGANLLASNGDARANKIAYNMNLQSVEKEIEHAIRLLKSEIGPWRCFFSGSAKPESQSQDNEICQKVKNFAIDNALDTKQFIILYNLARHVNDLTKEDIDYACAEVSDNPIVSKRMKKFLTEQKLSTAARLKCFPCILIVDELLDHFFWEMINEHQELCRISSLYLLKSIYSKYSSQVSDGYLKLSINKGNWILNPDKSLNDMERRISNFIATWDPKIDCVVDRQTPTADTITKYLRESDIFIYSGHGSGLQFFNGHKITNFHSHSVVFLLGCDSVRLKSDGLHSEMTGSHLYYFATQCPAVVGTILMAFDRKMDLMTTAILSSWIPTNKKVHWQSVDKVLWAKEGKVNYNDSKAKQNLYNPILPQILCELRQQADTNHSRVYFVYRGLPVRNINVE